MTKQEFIKKYNALTAAQKAEIRAYYEDIYKGAVLFETWCMAEDRLLWMAEADAK